MACLFLIVGHGELQGELTKLADDLRVTDRVRFLGLRFDVPDILRSSDYFLLYVVDGRVSQRSD